IRLPVPGGHEDAAPAESRSTSPAISEDPPRMLEDESLIVEPVNQAGRDSEMDRPGSHGDFPQ
ncbi:MAG TPA: hypothetical protein VI316_08775, partial [Candidatus Dormibacteraeota bacterium]